MKKQLSETDVIVNNRSLQNHLWSQLEGARWEPKLWEEPYTCGDQETDLIGWNTSQVNEII